MARIPGHGLQREGRAHDDYGRYIGGTTGYALCQCGWISDRCGTNAARKRLHEAHKATVLRAGDPPKTT